MTRRTIAMLVAALLGCSAASEPDMIDGSPDASPDVGDGAVDSAGDVLDALDTHAVDAPVDTPALPDVDPDTIPWQTGPDVGFGVARKDTGNPRGANAFIAYAGYGVSLGSAEKWATALYRATLRDRGVRFVYAVQGPATAAYSGKEIGNSKLAPSLLAQLGPSTKYVLVVGHSSGSFVAHELLGQLDGSLDPTGITRDRIVYFDLDGGMLGLTSSIVARLHRAYFVGSKSAENGTPSPNDSDMSAGAAKYSTEGATYFQNLAVGSRCESGANWCVHMTLITQKPHDPSGAEADLDYADFVGRPVVHAFIDAKASEAGLTVSP